MSNVIADAIACWHILAGAQERRDLNVAVRRQPETASHCEPATSQR